MKKYDSYKDSGVEWIGEIPSHWKKTKHKFNLSILSGYPFKSELFDKSEGFPLIRIRDISSGQIETYYLGEVLDKFVVKRGDLLIGMDGDFHTRWWDSEQGLLNQRCCSIYEDSNVLRRYLHYVLPIELDIINDLTYFTTVKHLSVDDINNTETLLPPLPEQQQIVSFLDTKTSLIDSLIEKTQRKIELLKEKRTSLINEVVTKGLNPNVEMKDSGVEWIGEIPSHWDNVSTKLVSRIVNGSTPKNNVEYWEGEVVWITPSDIGPIKEQVFISDSKRKITIEGLNSCGCSMCPKNSLILTNRGPIGNVVISTVEFTTNQGCKVMIPKENMNVKYLYYFFKISNEELNMLGQGTTFLELSTNSLSMFKVNLPPLSEQNEIVSYLDEQTQLIDKTISIEEKRIELLKEYRQSLISEVVTGKRKVVE